MLQRRDFACEILRLHVKLCTGRGCDQPLLSPAQLVPHWWSWGLSGDRDRATGRRTTTGTEGPAKEGSSIQMFDTPWAQLEGLAAPLPRVICRMKLIAYFWAGKAVSRAGFPAGRWVGQGAARGSAATGFPAQDTEETRS